ncbi:hypothetical protein PPEP_b0896 [Pseudoalteromonas peptidolytica F12-50-A1]|uniref:Uncharacterized protein n=1 Tax=Pseudoalteromonas peptidolytica F12-50-A1 TaxID=1315280 RepID=A0A8I0N0R2_9GAMM|nr:hypothetical protein [Pseudoalteromonas peptidolytica F12-50-A1]
MRKLVTEYLHFKLLLLVYCLSEAWIRSKLAYPSFGISVY